MRKFLLQVIAGLLLSTTEVHAEGDRRDEVVMLDLGIGPVVPIGSYADGHSAGFGGTASFGIMSGHWGLRLFSGSADPGERQAIHDAMSARVGRPIEVDESIVPLELQGLYRVRLGTSPFALRFQAGLGASNVVVRIKDSDDRLLDDWHVGYSGGVSLSAPLWPHSRIGLNAAYHRVAGSDPIDYLMGALELSILFAGE